VTNNAAIPSARSFATGWCDVDGKLYLFGGTGKGSTLATKGNLNDLWSYDPQANAWTWLSGSKAVNGAASYGTLGVAATTNVPGARIAATAIVDGTSNTLLFGGQATAGLMNDVWRYNSTSNQWTWLKGASTAAGAASYGPLNSSLTTNTPGARRGTVAISGIADGRSNTFIAGENGTNSFNDFWSLETRGEPTIGDLAVSAIGNNGATLGCTVLTHSDPTSVHLEWWTLAAPGTRTSAPVQVFDGTSNTVQFSVWLPVDRHQFAGHHAQQARVFQHHRRSSARRCSVCGLHLDSVRTCGLGECGHRLERSRPC
jgi:hypothetical protein